MEPVSFNKISISKKKLHRADAVANIRATRNYAHQIATSRSMSNNRLISTVGSTLLALFLAYSSFFYFPAFSSKKSYIKIATHNGVTSSIDKKNGNNNPYLDYLLMNQGYLKDGQTVSVYYELSPETKLDLIISKCAGPVILEIYSCRGNTIKVVETDANSGAFDITFAESGFYKFDEKLKTVSVGNNTFKVIWMRK